MGTEITLDIGSISIDYSKNHMGIDYGVLFQEKDQYSKNVEHTNETGKKIVISRRFFSKSLKEIVPRLDLLGYTLTNVEHEYNKFIDNWREEYKFMLEEEYKKTPQVLSFNKFCLFIKKCPIKDLDNSYIDSFDEKKIKGKFQECLLTKYIPFAIEDNTDAYSESSYFGNLISFLEPYSILRILSECDENLDLDVVWEYGYLVDNGWASEKDFLPKVKRSQTFLLATEGSSDVHIIKHAFSLLMPEVYDFFKFIDVTERHPFSGTGNLTKFAEGLIKIDILNNILFIFDNDAEGVDACNRVYSMELLLNMRAIVLPTLKEFYSFPAKGPDGIVKSDINGRAAAIECYLDLNLDKYPPANVIWTNYKDKLNIYQGALEHKNSYTKFFLKQTNKTIKKGKYNVSKLKIVLESIVSKSCEITSEYRLNQIKM